VEKDEMRQKLRLSPQRRRLRSSAAAEFVCLKNVMIVCTRSVTRDTCPGFQLFCGISKENDEDTRYDSS